MKKIITALFLFGITRFATAMPNYYVGLGLGYSNTNYSNSQLGANDGSTGIGSRFFGGYEITQNLSAELGWTHYAKASGNAVSSINEHAYDLSVVGRYPINASGLSVFGKFGFAYLRAEKNFAGQGHSYANKIRPAYGIGVSNVFTPNWSMTVQLWRIQGKNDAFSGSSGDYKLPSADLYTVGVIYRFV